MLLLLVCIIVSIYEIMAISAYTNNATSLVIYLV